MAFGFFVYPATRQHTYRNLARIVVAASVILVVSQKNLAQAQASHPGDINCDSLVALQDILLLIDFVFRSGASPCVALSVQTCQPSPRAHSPQPATVPGKIDTIRFDQIELCDPSASLAVGVYLHNHDSLLTLTMPIRVEQISGPGFLTFDSVQWVDRIADTATMDIVSVDILEVDGISPDWFGISLIDGGFGFGKPPLDSGSGYICRFHFTGTGGESVTSLTIAEYGFASFQYVARQFNVITHQATAAVLYRNGSGDVNCDGSITAADIILLVHFVFGTGIGQTH